MDVIFPPLKAYLADRGQGWEEEEEEEEQGAEGEEGVYMGGVGEGNQTKSRQRWVN